MRWLTDVHKECRDIATLVYQTARLLYAVKYGKPPKRVYKVLDLMDLYQQHKSRELYLRLIALEARLEDSGVPREELLVASVAVYQSVRSDYAALSGEIEAMMRKNHSIDVEYILEKYHFLVWLQEYVQPGNRSWYLAR